MKKRFFVATVVLALLLGLTACGTELPAVYVQTVSQIMGYSSLGEFNACAGVVVAQSEVKIERDESRKVAELKVEVGQEVGAGDVLFVYDTDEIQIAVDKVKLEIEQMKNTVKDLTSQISELEKEKKKAPKDDQLSYTVRIQGLETDKDETEYNIKLKEQELETLRDAAASGEVRAPIDGKIKAINEDGGYDNYTGQPLPYITLIQSGAFRVKGKVNELNRDEFIVGQSVIIRSRVDETMTWTGVLTELDSTPEDTNSGAMYYGYTDEMTSSSSYAFYVELDSTEGLLLGQHVYIEPDNGQTEETEGLWLYADYVLGSEEEGYYVWAANDRNELEKRAVTVGAFDDLQYAWLINEGLSVTDRVAFPAEDLQEGAPVTDTEPLPEEDVDLPAEDGYGDLPAEDEGSDLPSEAVFDGIFDDGVVEESAGQ